MENNVEIFISYARDDLEVAEKIYTDFKNEGLAPWLDIKDILPGQKWKLSVKKAITNSKYFIILLSHNSVSKKGYIQKELKYALNIFDELPESEIFIIPVRLDNCIPTNEKLEELNWADIFTSYDEGFKKILRVIRQEKDANRENWKNLNDVIINSKSKRKNNNKIFQFIALLFSISVVSYVALNNIPLLHD